MKRILVIEDDPRIASAITACLKGAGYEAGAAANAGQAFQIARQNPFDLFLVDVNLPDGDGLTLVEKFLSQPQTRHVAVIFLTASGSFQNRLRASRLGVFGWLEKPLRPEQLLHAVRVALEGEPTPEAHECRRRYSPLKPCSTRAARTDSTDTAP